MYASEAAVVVTSLFQHNMSASVITDKWVNGPWSNCWCQQHCFKMAKEKEIMLFIYSRLVWYTGTLH